MTPLRKPVRRITAGELDGSHGRDRGRKLVVAFEPGDLITIRPAGCRHSETVSLFDVYRFAIRCRAQRVHLEKARARKEAKQRTRESAAIRRMERRILE